LKEIAVHSNGPIAETQMLAQT